MADPGTFTLRFGPGDEGATLAVIRGEFDFVGAASIRKQLLGAITPGITMVLDLGGVEFMDSTGLGVLIAVLREVSEANGRLIVAKPPRRVCRLIEASGLTTLFGLDTRADTPPDPGEATIDELSSLLLGYENLLRWGDLTPQQLTIALRGEDLANDKTDLTLAARVRAVLGELGVTQMTDPED